MNDQPVQLLINLLGIYSPSGKEEVIADFIAEKMKQLGFRVKKDLIGNVIGEIGEGEPTILLCGHMDTVAGHLPLQIEKDAIYARGAVDAKGPLAAMITAAAAITQIPTFRAKIVVAIVVEEETTSRGVKHLLSDWISADYVIFGEPSGVGNITIGYKGNLHLRITCKTETGHSSTPWLYDNALEKAFEVWQEIKNSFPPLGTQQSPFHALTACLTKISGGKANSVIPFESEIHIDIRIPPRLTTTEVFNNTKKIIEQYEKDNSKVKLKVTIEDSNEAFEVDKSSILLKALSSSIRKVLNKPATLLRKTGTGDMNILGQVMNVPIVTYGPGDSHLDHTKNEHILIRDYLNAIEIYKDTILKLTFLHNQK